MATYAYPNVGAVVAATDPNDDTMTYSLGGADAGSFDIMQGNGQITVKTATELDLESKATYMVTVTATDPGNLSDSVDVTIMVTDEDEGPEIAGVDQQGLPGERTRVARSRPHGQGPEGRMVYWSLAGRWSLTTWTTDDYAEPTSHFSISADGVLSFNFPRLRDA